MDRPTSVDVDLGSSVWALGICGVLALLILCATCVILSITSNGKAPEVLTAFADVIRAFRRRARHEGSQSLDEREASVQLEKVA